MKMKLSKIVGRMGLGGAMAGVLLAGAPLASAANLVLNGDFESCSVVALSDVSVVNNCGWSFEHNAGVQASPTGGFSGNPGNFVRLEDNGPVTDDPVMRQMVSGLSIGTLYRLSWDLQRRVVINNVAPSFGVFLDSQTSGTALFLHDLPTPVPTGYVSQFVEFTASASSHTLIFAGELDGRSNGVPNPGGRTDVSYNIDNVCMDRLGGACGGVSPAPTVPEPSTWLLLGSGLAGLVLWRLRLIPVFVRKK